MRLTPHPLHKRRVDVSVRCLRLCISIFTVICTGVKKTWTNNSPRPAQLIQLPQLMDFIIYAECPGVFVILNKVLVMPVAVKRRLRLELPVGSMASRGWSHELDLIQSLSPI